MLRTLKVLMFIYGAVLILAGLSLIIIPDPMADVWGFQEITDFARYMMAACGASFIAAGVWVVLAGWDPLRHINWVKYVILKISLFIVVFVYSIIQGYIDFTPAFGSMIIVDAIFLVAFLVFYPWRVARVSA